MYTFDLFGLADGMEHIGDELWLADWVGHKMCDRLTKSQMAVNAWVAFATKNSRLVIIIIGYYFPGNFLSVVSLCLRLENVYFSPNQS